MKQAKLLRWLALDLGVGLLESCDHGPTGLCRHLSTDTVVSLHLSMGAVALGVSIRVTQSYFVLINLSPSLKN